MSLLIYGSLPMSAEILISFRSLQTLVSNHQTLLDPSGKKMDDHPPHNISIEVHPTRPGQNFHVSTVRFFHPPLIDTTLTSNLQVVEDWISMIWNGYELLNNPLAVGFGVFWTRSFPPAPEGRAATIQICVDAHCLIWQLREVVPLGIPHLVQQFFLHPEVRLVGVDNEMHAPLLWEHHRIRVNTRDLRHLAAARLGDFHLATQPAMQVATAVLPYYVPATPFNVFLSNWDAPVLTQRQVLHAAVYAIVSYRMGIALHANEW